MFHSFMFFLNGLAFWLFIAIKLSGTVFAAWSWWWLLLPLVPVLTHLLTLMGVLY